MNVFVLCTGRSGSVTFHRACSHFTNYTCGHESRTRRIGRDRLAYPAEHVEVDNRLAWLLGRLDRTFGDDAFYVHLTRDEERVARSFDQRWSGRRSIIRAYAEGIVGTRERNEAVCLDFVRTVNTNIRLFLRDKTKTMTVPIEEASEAFPEFYRRIGAQGELASALREFDVRHNPSPGALSRLHQKVLRAVGRPFR